MALSLSLTLGKLFGTDEKFTPAKINQLVGSLTAAISGTADTADLAAGAVTAAKTTPGAHFYALDSGSANAYVVAPSPALASLATGAWVVWQAANANTSTSTINVNGLGVKNIYNTDGNALSGGEIVAGGFYIIMYDGTQWIMIGSMEQTAARSVPGAYWFAADSGSTNSLVVDPDPALAAYADGVIITTRAGNTNFGACTVNVNSLGAKAIVHPGGEAMTAGDIIADDMLILVYDGSNGQFVLCSGPAIPRWIRGTATLDFPNTSAQNSSDLTVTVTGAVTGSPVCLSVPTAAVNDHTCFTAWVSAADTVTVRFNNYSSGAVDPSSGSFTAIVGLL